MGVPFKNDWLDIDIANHAVFRPYTSRLIGEGDKFGDVFGVRIFKNKEPYSLSGCSCTGLFIRPDNSTVVIRGGTNNNTAWVTLPEACYVYTGNFTLSLKIAGTTIDGPFFGTVRIVDGTVVDVTTNEMVDPGTLIPDLEDYLAMVSTIQDAAATIDKIKVSRELIEGTRYKIKVTKET